MAMQLQTSVIQALLTKTLAVRFWGADQNIDFNHEKASPNSPKSSTGSKTGQVNNLMSSDIKSFHEARCVIRE